MSRTRAYLDLLQERSLPPLVFVQLQAEAIELCELDIEDVLEHRRLHVHPLLHARGGLEDPRRDVVARCEPLDARNKLGVRL